MTYFNATESGWKPLITILWAIYHYIYHLAYDNKYIYEWCYWQNLCSVPGLWFVENVSVWSFLFCWMDQTLTLIIYLFCIYLFNAIQGWLLFYYWKVLNLVTNLRLLLDSLPDSPQFQTRIKKVTGPTLDISRISIFFVFLQGTINKT